MLNVLITHESSGVVRNAFRALGHNAWSCDLLPADDNSPFHYQCDWREAIKKQKWDFIGSHPACTYLCVSGIHWNDRGRGWYKTNESLEEVLELMQIPIPGYIENPVGIISTKIRKPDQIVQPYEFGDDASKKTCLWLRGGLPKLIKDEIPVAGRVIRNLYGKPLATRWGNQTDSGQNKLTPSATRWKERSKTYPGIARAMAKQWSDYLVANSTTNT